MSVLRYYENRTKYYRDLFINKHFIKQLIRNLFWAKEISFIQTFNNAITYMFVTLLCSPDKIVLKVVVTQNRLQ